MPSEKPLNEIASKLATKDDQAIIKAFNSMPIGQCSRIEVKEVLKTCLQLSGSQTPLQSDFDFIVDFVIENYGNFKLQELKAAFNLLATEKIQTEKHIIFNPKQVGEVMSAYKKIATEVRKLIPEQPKTTKIYQVDEEQSILEEQTWWEKSQKKDWRLLNHQVYDYLWKRKILNKDNVTPIANDIRQRVTNYLRNKAESDNDKFALTNDDFIRTQCKKYTLALYFNKQLKPLNF